MARVMSLVQSLVCRGRSCSTLLSLVLGVPFLAILPWVFKSVVVADLGMNAEHSHISNLHFNFPINSPNQGSSNRSLGMVLIMIASSPNLVLL